MRHSVDFALGFHGLPGPSAVEDKAKLIGLRPDEFDDERRDFWRSVQRVEFAAERIAERGEHFLFAPQQLWIMYRQKKSIGIVETIVSERFRKDLGARQH